MLKQFDKRKRKKIKTHHSLRISNFSLVHVFDLATRASNPGLPFFSKSPTASPDTSPMSSSHCTASRANVWKRAMAMSYLTSNNRRNKNKDGRDKPPCYNPPSILPSPLFPGTSSPSKICILPYFLLSPGSEFGIPFPRPYLPIKIPTIFMTVLLAMYSTVRVGGKGACKQGSLRACNQHPCSPRPNRHSVVGK